MQEVVINKKKKIINVFIVLFIILILFLTFISKSIYNMLLPTVEITKFKSGELEYNYYENGTVDYENKYSVYSKNTYEIKDVFIKEGQDIHVGDKIASVNLEVIKKEENSKNIDIANLNNEINELRLDNNENNEQVSVNKSKIDTLNNQYNAINTNPQYQDYDEKNLNVERELINNQILDLNNEIEKCTNTINKNNNTINARNLEISKIREEINALKDGLNNEGNIISTYTGKVLNISCEVGKKVSEDEEICRIADTSKGVYAKWQSSVLDAGQLAIDNDVEISVDGLSSKETIKANIKSKKFEEESDMYEFTASLPKEEGIEAGKKITINNSTKSESYDFIIPKECVFDGERNSKIIYGLYEKSGALGTYKYIKKVKVKVLAEDNYNYAISLSSMDFDQVVVSCSREISDNMKVRVK